MIRACVLFGGNSTEREVSVLSAENVSGGLNRDKYNVKMLEIAEDGNVGWVRELMDWGPDVVFPALHGGAGENGTVQGMLEVLGLPYVGSKVLASAVCMNKNMAKAVLRAAAVRVPRGVLLKSEIGTVEAVARAIGGSGGGSGFPLVVKPNNGGSSVGVEIVQNAEGLRLAIKNALKVDKEALVEELICGRELTVGVVETRKGLQALDVLEIKPKRSSFFDYNAKYSDDGAEESIADLSEDATKAVQRIAVRAFSAVGCAGCARVDMILSESGEVFVLEINTLPGLTKHSLIPKAAESRWSFANFLDMLIESELWRGGAGAQSV